jgi:Flp pilus assembly protein TadG
MTPSWLKPSLNRYLHAHGGVMTSAPARSEHGSRRLQRSFRDRLGATSRRGSRQDGAIAVEFALILPLLLLILLGTIEFGRVYSQMQVFQGAAREGARCAAVAASSTCSIQDRIDSASGAYTPGTTASVQVGTGPVVAADSSAAGCSNATVGQDVRVYWSQPLEIEIAFWKDVTISADIEGVFRCE